jgi:hypothetical protein
VEPEQLELVTQFLAEMGSLIHFPDPYLHELVVLNPQWLADLMSSLLTFRHQWAKNGILRRKHLPHVFEKYKPEMFKSLLALLERFSILYPLRADLVDGELDLDGRLADESNSNSSSSSSSLSSDSPSRSSGSSSKASKLLGTLKRTHTEVDPNEPQAYLVPARLPVTRPNAVAKYWPDILPVGYLEQGRVYEFSFLPLGFFSRFMVYVLHMPGIVGRIFWADGLVIMLDEYLAKVEYEHHESLDEGDRVCVYQLNISVRFPIGTLRPEHSVCHTPQTTPPYTNHTAVHKPQTHMRSFAM